MAQKKLSRAKTGKTRKTAIKKEPRVQINDGAKSSDIGPCLRAYESVVKRLSSTDRSAIADDLELLHDAVVDCPRHCGCSDREKTSIIFSADGVFLGELTTRSGGLTGLMLSRDGDELLGAEVESWQVIGLHQNETLTPVKLNDGRFLEAFGIWCGNNGCKIVTLLAPQLELWNAIQASALPEEERCYAIQRVAQEPLDNALRALAEILGG